MEINDKLVSYVAELAHLKLDDDQRAQAAADLARVLVVRHTGRPQGAD